MVRVPGCDREVLHPRLRQLAGARALVALVDRPQVGLEVLGQRLRVLPADVLGVLLDEEVERVDHLEVGDQADGDGEAAGAGREHQAGQEVAERVLLPVDEVVGWFDLERVGLDRGTRVRRGTQPDDVWKDLHQSVERVAGAMLQRHLDTHGVDPTTPDTPMQCACPAQRCAKHAPQFAESTMAEKLSTNVPTPQQCVVNSHYRVRIGMNAQQDGVLAVNFPHDWGI